MKKEVLQKLKELSWDERLLEEKSCWQAGFQHVAGLDEAGRGPLAGPVVAAVFVITPEFKLEGLNDSKQLSEAKRELFFQQLISGDWDFGVGVVEPAEIDRINIYQASRMSMVKALAALKAPPDFLLVDALTIPETQIPQKALIHGDARSVAIAAASVIAKYTRDRIMTGYEAIYPGYGFARHKGYPTRQHYEALANLGPSPIHRRSFRLASQETHGTLDLFGEEV
jgi:ribonuclease HII